ncbi:unnamed protein product [Closterium sp. Yama58-4]|nr:unnamed protein product [Closterium sp. Yama58-4]
MSRPVEENPQVVSTEDLSLSVPVSRSTKQICDAATWQSSNGEDDSPLAGTALFASASQKSQFSPTIPQNSPPFPTESQESEAFSPATIILLLPDGGAHILTEPVTAGALLQGFSHGTALVSVTSCCSTLPPEEMLRLGSTYHVVCPRGSHVQGVPLPCTASNHTSSHCTVGHHATPQHTASHRAASACSSLLESTDLSTSRDAGRSDAAFGKSISLPREVLEATEVNLWREKEQQLRHGCPSSPLLAEGDGDDDDGSGVADCWTAEDVPTEVDGEEDEEEVEEKAVAAKAPAWGAESWGADSSVIRSSSSGGGAGGRTSCALIGHVSSAAEAADVAAGAAARVRAMALQAANELVESYRFPGSFTSLSRPPTAPCALLGPGNTRGNRPGDLPGRLAYAPQRGGNGFPDLQYGGGSMANAASDRIAVARALSASLDGSLTQQAARDSPSELEYRECHLFPHGSVHGTRLASDTNACVMEGNGTPCRVKPGCGSLDSRRDYVEENEPWSNQSDVANPVVGWSQNKQNGHKSTVKHTQASHSGDGGSQANVVRSGVGEPCEALGSMVLRRAAIPALLSSMNPPRSPSSPLSPSFSASELILTGILVAPMGIVLGRINVETPQFTVEAKTDAFEIRRYPPQMVAEVTYDGDHQNGINTAFSALAGYIGALSAPQNRPAPATSHSPGEGGEKIAMTAPVLTHAVVEGEGGGGGEGGEGDGAGRHTVAGEKIAMTAPVLTHSGAGEGGGGEVGGKSSSAGEKIAMTAPVVTGPTSSPGKTTMQFLLPASLTPATTPIPTNPAVTIHQLPPRLLGAVTFSGLTTQSVLQHKSQELRAALEAGGYKVCGDYVVGRYNPPFTLPFMRTNEILYPIEG